MSARRLLLAWLLVGTGVVGARATVAVHDFALDVEVAPESIEDGQSVSGVLLLGARVDQEIESLQLVADGWRIDAFEPPPLGRLRAGETWRIPFTVTPLSEDLPLELRVRAGGQEQQLLVAPALHRARRVRRLDALAPIDWVPVTTGSAPPLPPVEEMQKSRDEGPQGAPAGTPRSIRIHGAVGYQRVDGVWKGAYGLVVEVYDQDLLGSDLLGTSTCGHDGRFDFTVTFNETLLDQNPDLKVRFVANSVVAKIRPKGALSSSYSWTQGPWNDFTGVDLDLGALGPLDNEDHPVLHILNNLTRAWTVLSMEGQGAVPQVTVVYPDDVWPHYDPTFERIHLPRDYDEDPNDPNNPLTPYQWMEDTHIHEYGHHVMHRWGSVGTIDYCNNLCDVPDCGHCLYCAETEEIAWSEGWSDWFSEYVTLQFPALAGDTAFSAYTFEETPSCGTAPEVAWNPPICDCDGWTTEGFFASLLHDLVDPVDSNQVEHEGLFQVSWWGRDDLEMGSGVVWDLSFGTGVTTPRQFLDLLGTTHPGMEEPIWFTAALNSYDLDQQPPGLVGSLSSPTHPVGTPSSNAIVEITWTPASDDFSGIEGYFYKWGPAPAMPDTLLSTDLPGDATSWTSPPTDPGDWYFSISAMDHSHRRSPTFASYGPITILPPTPADVSATVPTGWDGSIVPRPAADASLDVVTAPTVLNPFPGSTWVNCAVMNSGETNAPPMQVWGFFDEKSFFTWDAWFGVPPGFVAKNVNLGPQYATPGLHTLWLVIDPLNEVYESDEYNNLAGFQWVWEPPMLGRDDTAPQLGFPGAATAGWPALSSLLVFYNVDGFRMHSYDGFHAASLRASINDTDYDLRLYEPASSATSGFFLYDAWSTEPAGRLDVVVTNSDAGGVRDYDLGVLNLQGTNAGNYELKTYGAGTAAVGDSVSVPVAVGEYLFLRQFQITPADTGAVTVKLTTDPASGPWTLSVFDPSTVHATLGDAPWDTTAQATGACALHLQLSQTGRYALIAHREPIGGTQATSVVYEIERTPPDLASTTPPNWYASIVARPTTGNINSVPAPGYLPAYQPVYPYVALTNLGPNAASGFTVGVEVDGISALGFTVPSVQPGELSRWQPGTVVVGPGRHTLVGVLDPETALEELDENNNREGQQYVFEPYPLDATPLDIPTPPPSRMAGIVDIPVGAPAFYNCFGLRLRPDPEGFPSDSGWYVAAVMPPVGEDVDLRVHQEALGGVDGFGFSLSQSNWGLEQSDFVVVHPDSISAGTVDLGVVAIQSATGFTASASGDQRLKWDSNSPGEFSNLGLMPREIARLFSLDLPAGEYRARLIPQSARADLGLSVFLPDGSGWALAKGEETPGGGSWYAPVGQTETALFGLTVPGNVLVVVWKTSASDLAEDQPFTLAFAQDTSTDTPSGGKLPSRVAITGTWPNPFNPRLEIAYELPAEGRVRLAVYDPRGHAVAILVDQPMAAGRHQVVWTATDDRGRSVSSGVYFLRLEGPGGRDGRKVVLVR